MAYIFESSRAKIRIKLQPWAFRACESKSSVMGRLPRKNQSASYLQFVPLYLTNVKILEPHRKFSLVHTERRYDR